MLLSDESNAYPVANSAVEKSGNVGLFEIGLALGEALRGNEGRIQPERSLPALAQGRMYRPTFSKGRHILGMISDELI